MSPASRKSLVRFLVLLTGIASVCGCRTTNGGRWRNERLRSFAQLERELLRYDPALEEFEGDGPFAYDVRKDIAFRLRDGRKPTDAATTIVADLAIPRVSGESPLVILVHGNHSAKEAHRYQAERLASFGMHAMVLQVENTAQWLHNGRLIAALVKRIARRPEVVAKRIDTDNIVLVGHSFGGSAITVAAGRGAPIKGLVLLDPAVVGPKVAGYMRKVDEPAMLLGADRGVFRARKRRWFYDKMGGDFAEVSVRGATHDDAQNPSMFSLSALGIDPYTSSDHQELFTAAICAAAFSFVATGAIDWAWQAFADETRAGRLAAPRRRTARRVTDDGDTT